MDQTSRNRLRNVVTQCRRLLDESIAQQLQGKYDIYATGKKDEVRAAKELPLVHLSDEEWQARQDILAHFDHIKALGYKPREALEQLIREIAFTHLNRFCAYKMMEVRDVHVGGQKFREAVTRGLKSQGFLFYLADNPEDEKRFNAGQKEESYRHFLNWLGGTLSQEIGVLFSPTDPANRVYPPQRVLEEVLDLLNSEKLKGIWSEDDLTGLTRIANEIRRRLLVPKKDGATQDELLRAPVLIPHRPEKDPREIKILDPACGSGHFVLYCFGLLLVIYEEAYDDVELGTALRAEYPTKKDLHRALPGLILRHNAGAYGLTKNNVYASFVERALAVLINRGRVGAITSRTGFFLTSIQKWREEILLGLARPVVFADLGYGVLDAAMVETAAYCLEKQESVTGEKKKRVVTKSQPFSVQ